MNYEKTAHNLSWRRVLVSIKSDMTRVRDLILNLIESQKQKQIQNQHESFFKLESNFVFYNLVRVRVKQTLYLTLMIDRANPSFAWAKLLVLHIFKQLFIMFLTT